MMIAKNNADLERVKKNQEQIKLRAITELNESDDMSDSDIDKLDLQKLQNIKNRSHFTPSQ